MSAIAGRVLILPKGDYDASAVYEFLDLVNHNSSSWLAKKASTGVEPSDENSEFWQKFGSSVTPDGVTIVIDENGVISAVGGTAEKVTYENENVADVTNVKEALDGIFDGTQPVGDSSKLGGKSAEEWESELGNASALTTNMFKPPTYSSITDDGITCTYNADGSLTFNGQSGASSSADFVCFEKNSITLKKGKYKIMLNPSAESDLALGIGGGDCTSGLEFTKIYDSAVIEIPQTGTIGYFLFQTLDGTTLDNVTLRPIMTTNLNVTYEDFVPYTGSTGKLNGDVAEVVSVVDTIKGKTNITDSKLKAIGTEGWYRIAEFDAGIKQMCSLVSVNNIYGGKNGESITLSITICDDNISIAPFSILRVRYDSIYLLFTKCRITKDSANGKIFVEIYYTGSNSTNSVLVRATELGSVSYSGQHITAISPISTEETVDGVTVLATYDIPLKTAGDKPSGTYTGNGSATSRTISTGGIGNVCIINSTYGVAFVTEYGAFVKLANSTSVSGLSSGAVNFKDGVLTIATTDQKVNNSSTEYTYTVL